MVERFTLPATFDCTRLRARVTDAGCGRMWKSAHDKDRAPKPWESRAACHGCPIGAIKAGDDLQTAVSAARAQQVASVCVRCGTSGRRMVRQTHCVSCYNRLREATIGRDARGRPPRHSSRLFAISLTVTRPSGLIIARDCPGVTSRSEAILTMAKLAAGDAITISWSRLVDLPAFSQPELLLGVPFAVRPRRPRAPSCPVSVFAAEAPVHVRAG